MVGELVRQVSILFSNYNLLINSRSCSCRTDCSSRLKESGTWTDKGWGTLDKRLRSITLLAFKWIEVPAVLSMENFPRTATTSKRNQLETKFYFPPSCMPAEESCIYIYIYLFQVHDNRTNAADDAALLTMTCFQKGFIDKIYPCRQRVLNWGILAL